MALYEIVLALHKDDNPSGLKLNPSVKEGDICGAYSYPKDHGKLVLDKWLIVIVRTSASLKALELMCKQPVYRSLINQKIISYDYFDIMTNGNPAAEKNYIKILKARYSISFDILFPKIPGIDFKKVRNPKLIYQPCKKQSQINNYFNGLNGHGFIDKKNIDTSTPAIDKEDEVIIDLDSTSIIYDKLSKTTGGL